MSCALRRTVPGLVAILACHGPSEPKASHGVINDNFPLVAHADVVGVVVDSAGAPLPGVGVVARVQFPHVSLIATTDSTGQFVFRLLRLQTSLPAVLPETLLARVVTETSTRELASTMARIVFDTISRPAPQVRVRLQRGP